MSTWQIHIKKIVLEALRAKISIFVCQPPMMCGSNTFLIIFSVWRGTSSSREKCAGICSNHISSVAGTRKWKCFSFTLKYFQQIYELFCRRLQWNHENRYCSRKTIQMEELIKISPFSRELRLNFLAGIRLAERWYAYLTILSNLSDVSFFLIILLFKITYCPNNKVREQNQTK